MRSPAQRRNDKKLGQMAKKRFSTKRKTTKRRTTPKKNMARRKTSRRTRYYSGARRTFSRKSGSKIVTTVRPYASGIGGGLLAETVAQRVGGGQYSQIAGYAGAYLTGGVKGVIGKVGFDLLSGRGIGLGIGGGPSNGGLTV